jgi:hypothetical protein
MNCPICGKENPYDARECRFCKATLTNPVNVKVSRLAIAAIVLAFCGLILIIPFFIALRSRQFSDSHSEWVGITLLLGLVYLAISFILGIISLIRIEKSGGLTTGRNFAIGAVLISVLVCISPLWLISLRPPTAYRMICGTNLSGIGKAMILYANDYDYELPRAGDKTTVWANELADWKANTRYKAYGIAPDGSGGKATISSSLYLLVKYAGVEPEKFICSGEPKIKEFVPHKYGVRDEELIKLWDFGPEPWKHCSYCYHIPYGDYALTTSSDPALALAADRNPWIPSPVGKVKDFSLFNPDGDRNDVMAGNSPSHKNEAQNVLYVDIHVSQEKTSTCGVNDDNIYTSWDGEDIRRGIPPKLGSRPADKLDSLLVNDPPIKKH